MSYPSGRGVMRPAWDPVRSRLGAPTLSCPSANAHALADRTGFPPPGTARIDYPELPATAMTAFQRALVSGLLRLRCSPFALRSVTFWPFGLAPFGSAPGSEARARGEPQGRRQGR